MINTGYHVYPGEIEEAIGAIPGVAATRVVGEAGPRGEMIVAHVVLAAGAARGDVEGRLRDRLPTRLAKYKLPRDYRFVERPPEL